MESFMGNIMSFAPVAIGGLLGFVVSVVLWVGLGYKTLRRAIGDNFKKRLEKSRALQKNMMAIELILFAMLVYMTLYAYRYAKVSILAGGTIEFFVSIVLFSMYILGTTLIRKKAKER